MSSPAIPPGTTIGPILPPHSLDSTMGAALLGVIFAMALWGAGCIQAFYYFDRYREDPSWMKIMVTTVIMFSTAHQALICHAIYTYLVTWYGHVSFLSTVVNTLTVSIPFSGCIIFIIQLFFIWRVWRLSKQNIALTAFLALQATAAFALLIVYTVKFAQLPSLPAASTIQKWAISLNAIGASCDISIAAALVWYLYQSQSQSTAAEPENIVNRIITFSVNTGVITSICALASLVTLATMPHNLVYTVFFFCVSKLFINSLLATLNARKGVKGGSVDGTDVINMSNLSPRDTETGGANSSSGQRSKAHEVAINITTQTETRTTRAIDFMSIAGPESDYDQASKPESLIGDSTEQVEKDVKPEWN